MPYSDTSYACRYDAERRIEDIVIANAIFVGELVKYEVIKPKEEFNLSSYAVLTFVVDEYIGREMSEKRMEVYWHNSTFGMPEKLKHNRYLVAITTGKQPPMRGPTATMYASQRPDLPSVLQAPCSDPFLLEPTTQNIEQVKKLVEGRLNKEPR